MSKRASAEGGETRAPKSAPRYPRKKSEYGKQSAGLAVLMLAAAALQTLMETGRGAGASFMELVVIAAGATVMVAAFIFISWKKIYRYLASADAAVVVLGALLVMTVIGTIVLQGVDEPTFRSRYPNMGELLVALHFNDIFHSYPFMLLLWVLAITSLITVYRRRKSFKKWRHAGLLISHISVLLILLGGFVGSLSAKKGMIHLVVSQSANAFETDPKPNKPSEVVPLNFALRLDKFELDHYEPEFKFYTFQQGAEGFEMVSAEEPEVGEHAGSPPKGSAVTVTVLKAYKSIKAVQVGEGKHTLRMPDGKMVPVTMGQTVKLPSGDSMTVQKFLPDFVIDMESHQASTRSEAPNNPALVVSVAKAGAEPRTSYLFGRADIRKNAHPDESGVIYSYRPGEMAYQDQEGGEPNPAVEVEIKGADGKVDKTLLFGKNPRAIDLGGGRLLVYKEKPEMIKNYRSTLTVLRDGHELMTQEIKVNHPMYFEGFAFYQANYDPNNPLYSGIEVVRDPGLPIVNFGLWTLMLGVFHTIALRNWKPWWERKGTTPAVGEPEMEAAA